MPALTSSSSVESTLSFSSTSSRKRFLLVALIFCEAERNRKTRSHAFSPALYTDLSVTMNDRSVCFKRMLLMNCNEMESRIVVADCCAKEKLKEKTSAMTRYLRIHISNH